MEKVLTLKTPLMVDGEELKELPYDFEAMTAGSLLRIAGDMAATGHSRTTVQEYDSDYHFFLFAQAVELATKGKVSTPDVLRLSAIDAIKGGALARSFSSFKRSLGSKGVAGAAV